MSRTVPGGIQSARNCRRSHQRNVRVPDDSWTSPAGALKRASDRLTARAFIRSNAEFGSDLGRNIVCFRSALGLQPSAGVISLSPSRLAACPDFTRHRLTRGLEAAFDGRIPLPSFGRSGVVDRIVVYYVYRPERTMRYVNKKTSRAR